MVADVLDALATVERLAAIVVVTREPVAVEAARGVGAQVVDDPEEAGQSAAAGRGVRVARERGAERVLLVPGDCPALEPGEVEALLDGTADARGVVIVPDRHGEGTNALLLAPPDLLTPAFGEGSFARHVASARAAGVEPGVAALPSLALDVDTPDDLAALRAALAAHPSRARRTRAALAALAADAARPLRA